VSETPPGDAATRLDRLRAAAEAVDTDSRLLAATRWLRRRLPGDDRFGDPLSTAGEAPVEMLGRRVSLLQPERLSVTRELGLSALQLWQGLSEMQGRGRGERELAVLFCDLVGFSAWALRAGDEAAIELLRQVGAELEAAVIGARGTIVKRLGDGLMAVFADVNDAVEAGLAASEALAPIEVEGYRPRLRTGVHVGRPRRLGGDYLGVDVNIAARVVDAAGAGEVMASDTAFACLDHERFHVGRDKRLKATGAPRELRVARVQRAR
jgi:adenylate cyclase